MSHQPLVAFTALALSLGGCQTVPNAQTISRPAQDTTAPTALWLQADLPGRPLGNAYLAGNDSAMEIGEPGRLVLTAMGTDNDGGVRSVRLFYSYARSTASSQGSHGLVGAPAVENASSAAVGEAAPTTLRASIDVDTGALLGGYNDLEIKAWAEVENFGGAMARTAKLTIPVRLVKLRLQALWLSDTDGTRSSNVTSAGFATMVERLNRRFEGTRIRFVFDPATDWVGNGSTNLNRDAADQRALGNARADSIPGKLLVLLRWGPSPDEPTGNSNAYPPPGIAPSHPDWNTLDQRYVAMAGRLDINASSFLNLGWGNHFAHEVGHYLGLYHTFPGFDSTFVFGGTVPPPDSSTRAQDAQNALVRFAASHGGGVAAFDGDGHGDTPPDPNPTIYQILGRDPCTAADLVINGVTADGTAATIAFRPDPENVMSYFGTCSHEPDGRDSPQGFTPQQIDTMHRALRLPERVHLLR